MIGLVKRFVKGIGVIVFSIFGILLFLWFLLTLSLGSRTTEFKDCFPPVTIVSTETTPNIQIERFPSSSFKIVRGDYRICISDIPCRSSGLEYYKSIDFPVGTEVILDGFAVELITPGVSYNTYFRGEIESKRVWFNERYADLFFDPMNENSFKTVGIKDELGQKISWACSTKKGFFQR